MTFSGSEFMPWTIIQLSPKPQMSERRSKTICAAVEWPNHHVFMTLYLQEAEDELFKIQMIQYYRTSLNLESPGEKKKRTTPKHLERQARNRGQAKKLAGPRNSVPSQSSWRRGSYSGGLSCRLIETDSSCNNSTIVVCMIMGWAVVGRLMDPNQEINWGI